MIVRKKSLQVVPVLCALVHESGRRLRRRGILITLVAALAVGSCGLLGGEPSSWQGQRQHRTVLKVDELAEWGVETAEIVFERRGSSGLPLKVRLLIAATVRGDSANASGFLDVRSGSQMAVYRLTGQAHRFWAAGAQRSIHFELSAERWRGNTLPVRTWLLMSVNEDTDMAEMYIGRMPRFVSDRSAAQLPLLRTGAGMGHGTPSGFVALRP